MPTPKWFCTPFDTLHTDLRQPEDTMFAAIQQTVRYEIRRGQNRDGLEFECWVAPPSAIVDEFLDRYHALAEEKGLAPLRPDPVPAYAGAGLLHLTRATINGETIVWHAYTAGSTWVNLIRSVSLFRTATSSFDRQLTGRANKALHWFDMLHYKSAGVVLYDWGGWYTGGEDREKLLINQFKAAFGGSLVHTFDNLAPASTVGTLYLWAKRASRRGVP